MTKVALHGEGRPGKAHFPGFGDFQGLPVLQKLGVDGVGVVVVEDKYILVSAGREYMEAAFLVIV